MLRRGWLTLWLVGMLAAPAAAQTFYVDASCTYAGNGAADSCATSVGQPGAWKDAAVAFATARAGHTVLFKNGTYVTTSQGTGDPSVSGGFSIAASGTSTSRITFKNYPGHAPLLANCPLAQTTYCPRPTISAPNREYVTVEGFKIHGGVWIYGISETSGSGSKGMIFRNNEIDTGWGEVDDGNWAAFFIDGQAGARFENNYIHDVRVPSGGGSQSSGSAFKLYYNSDVAVINNTVRRVNIPESQAGGIDDKAWGLRNVYRGNWIEDVNTAVRLNTQSAAHAIQGLILEGNVFKGWSGGNRGCIRITTYITSARINNNTCLGFLSGVFTEGGPAKIDFYNNIVGSINAGGRTVEAYTPVFQRSDYNVWAPGFSWTYPGMNATSLAGWQTASGMDRGSLAATCAFADAALRLSPGPCVTAGRAGGVSSGAPVEAGAYGAVGCVGYTCGATTPPQPPTCTLTAAPTSRTMTAAAQTFGVSVTASATTCGWTATSGASWLTLSAASGTGSGSVVVTAAENTAAARTGTVTVAGQAVTVSQNAGTTTPVTETQTCVQNVISNTTPPTVTASIVPCPGATATQMSSKRGITTAIVVLVLIGLGVGAWRLLKPGRAGA